MKTKKSKVLSSVACSCALLLSMMASALAASDKPPPAKATPTPKATTAVKPIAPPLTGKEVSLKGTVIPGGILKAEDGEMYIIGSEGKGGAVMAEEGKKVAVTGIVI